MLPTHPLRVAWIAGYTQLLRGWESKILEREPRHRKGAIDMRAARLLALTNVPAFAFHALSSGPSCSSRIYVSTMVSRCQLGCQIHNAAMLMPPWCWGQMRGRRDLRSATRATEEHLTRFRDVHPYCSELVTTLINPDQGDFFAEALTDMLRQQPDLTDIPDVESREPSGTGAIQITAFVDDPRKSSLQAFEQVRRHKPKFLENGDWISFSRNSRPHCDQCPNLMRARHRMRTSRWWRTSRGHR